jgi:hypothetical protein
MISLKRFFTNKNTVTIIGVVIVLIILYYGYSSTIKKAVNPTRVPIAAHDLQPQTQITSSDIKWIEVPSVSKDKNVLTNSSAIVGKYVGVNSMIPEGSMFYASSVVEKEDLPGNWLTLLSTDEIPIYYSVTLVSTFSNSIQPGDYVDIYMRGKSDKEGKYFYGKFIENKDSSGKDVFTSSGDVGTPAYIYFGLEKDYYYILTKASFLTDVQLMMVPHGGAVPLVGDVEVTSKFLREWVESHTDNSADEIEKVDEEDKDKKDDKDNKKDPIVIGG